MPLKKPWQDAGDPDARRIPGTLGVYEIADGDGNIIYIGFAGGRSRFGLRGEIESRLSPDSLNAAIGDRGRRYRYEVNMMYLTRYVELLEQHLALTGALPTGNQQPGEYIPRLGRALGIRGGGEE